MLQTISRSLAAATLSSVHRRAAVQAIRSRRYVNQKEITEALGIDQRRVSEALTRAVAFDMISEAEWKKCREAAKELRKGTGVLFDAEDNPDF